MPASSTATDWSRLHADYVGTGVPFPVTCTAELPLTTADSERLDTFAQGVGAPREVVIMAMLGAFAARYLGGPIRVLGQLPPSAGRSLEAVLDLDLEVVGSLHALAAHCVQARQPASDGPGPAGVVLRVHEPTDPLEQTPARLHALDLDIAVTCARDALRLTIVFDADRIARETGEAIVAALHTCLRHLVASPQAPLPQVPLIDVAVLPPHAVATHAGASTSGSRSRATLAHHALEQLAVTQPNAVVAELGGLRLSAHELNARANRLALRLVERGVEPDVLVGIAMERSIELLVAIFAVLKAGGAFVPLDPDLPVDRLAHMIGDAQAPLLLTQSHVADAVRGAAAMAQAVVLSLPASDLSVPTAHYANVSAHTRTEHVAYVLYTSGTTGKPKGVRVPHRALVNHATWFAAATGLTATDRVLHYASISFDAALAELFAPIVAGARIVLAPAHAHRDLLGLFEFARAARISVMQAVPSVLRAALANDALREPPPLRYLVSGGEALDHALITGLRQQLPDTRLGNFYGPTEACVDSTHVEIDAALLMRRTIPIGRPIANARCLVLDPHRQLRPIGAPGELYVGGAGLAQGYHGQSALTAERFVTDPWRPGERLYRTGDRARVAPDGMIEYLGRTDSQVKVRGYRLEVAEIEAELRDFPGVREAAVIARPDVAGERVLVAWIVAGDLPPSSRAMAARLRQQLPAWAVPSYFGTVDALPITTSGKLDRRALEQLPLPVAATGETREREPVADPIARRLVPLWEHVLGVSPIGIDDAFFDLGGHSLKAIRLLNDIEREFGLDVRAGVLFEAPTIRALAARLRDRRARPVSTLIPVQPAGRRAPLFFVPGGGGELFVFDAIAHELGREQPLHVVDLYALGEHADVSETSTLADIVRVLLPDLRRVQPSGPYRLAGYSLGGKIALELAHQLRAAGEQVEALLLLDADAPGYPHLQALPRRLLTHAAHALSLGPRGMLRYLRERAPRVARRLGLATAEPHRLFTKEADLALVPPDVIDRMERAIAPVIAAWERYQPAPYHERVTLLRAEVRQVMIGVTDTDPKLGWGPLLPALHVETVACGHFDLLRAAQAPRLAQLIATQLDSA
jgi:amino acid adenylation domain-containing protein